MSGSTSSMPVIATCTQSVGVPATRQVLRVELLDHADRHVEGQRIAGAGAVAVRRDDQDLVAGVAQALGEDPDAGRIDAVVVAYQYAHEPLFRAPSQCIAHHDSGCTRPAAGLAGGRRSTLGLRHDRTTRPARRGCTGRRRGACSATRSARCANCRPRRAPPAAPRPRPVRAWRDATKPMRAANSSARSMRRRWKPATRCAIAATKCRRACCSDWRAGEYAAQDELDLHGADVAQAEALLRGFLRGIARTQASAACASSTARACTRTAACRC